MAVGKRSSEKALQKVLGKGANVNADNPLEVHDPKVGKLQHRRGCRAILLPAKPRGTSWH
ncbi:hypothetical protein ES705_48338 [subsurface metagenome]